jgi:hypothetical protein
LDDELAIVVDSTEFTNQVNKILKQDAVTSHELTPEEKHRFQSSPGAQIIGRVQQAVFARFF